MKILLSLLFALLHFTLVSAQTVDSTALKYAETIKIEDLKKHLEIIASDEFEGRETGANGLQLAAEYIQRQFTEMGVSPLKSGRYYQNFPLLEQEIKGIDIKIGDRELTPGEDFISSPKLLRNERIGGKAFFISLDDFSFEINDSLKSLMEGAILFVDYGDDKKNVSRITELGKEWNIASLLIFYPEFEKNTAKLSRRLSHNVVDIAKESAYQQFPSIYINESLALELFGEELKKLKKSLSKKTDAYPLEMDNKVEVDVNRNTKILSSQNVLGYIEGEDKADELLVITAHYDHLGIMKELVVEENKSDSYKEVIYNGADDDGSGTVAILEIAEAFILAKKNGVPLKRSILFMTVAGEEKGLLGSSYYTENPIFPLENTIANLNIDMIGRHDKNHEPGENYVYLIGSDKLSDDLHRISEEANTKYCQLELDYKFNDPKDKNRFYYRSDHYNFAKNNIPVIFYFSGVHEDYHKPTDTIDKIDFEMLRKRTELVFFTAWKLINAEERPKLN